MSTPAIDITPDVAKWARGRIRASLEHIATSVGIDKETLESWESGKSKPTFRQAEKLAHVLRIPFGYLFLSSVPSDPVALPDLRTIAGRPMDASPDLVDVVNDILRKQHWYGEFLMDMGIPALPFVGAFSKDDGAESVADNIRSIIGINDDLRRQCATWSEFFTTVVRLTEDAGIVVMRSGIVAGNTRRPLSVQEFRGFAISDVYAPAVFINSKDAKVAQIFTLAHELAHIWIGESGVSNPDFGKTSAQQVNAIEKFCNRVAAEVLVPSSGFQRNWKSTVSAQENMLKLSTFYRVSRFVVLRQAFDLGLIAQKEYAKLIKLEYDKYLKGNESSGGNYYNSLFARNSYKLTAAVTSALAEGQVLYTEAARLLGVRVPILEKLGAIL
jgi:Zn-dependent peptidase ImmA (M78 family)/transcriptional regulator with XRE-family HTH domain